MSEVTPTEPVDDKLWYKSKLVWLGIFQVVIGALASLTALLQKEVITPADISFFVMGVMTIVLRVFFTDTAVAKQLK